MCRRDRSLNPEQASHSKKTNSGPGILNNQWIALDFTVCPGIKFWESTVHTLFIPLHGWWIAVWCYVNPLRRFGPAANWLPSLEVTDSTERLWNLDSGAICGSISGVISLTQTGLFWIFAIFAPVDKGWIRWQRQRRWSGLGPLWALMGPPGQVLEDSANFP